MKKATIANAIENATATATATENTVSTASKKEEKAMTENIATAIDATAISESAKSETAKPAKAPKTPKTAKAPKKRAAAGKKKESIENMAKASQASKTESTHIANSATESVKMATADTPNTANPETLKAIAELLGIASDDTKAIVQAVRKAAGEKERAKRISDCETFTSRKKLIARYPDMDINDNYPTLFKNGFTYSVFPSDSDPEKPDFIAVTYYFSKSNSYEYRSYRLGKDMQAIRDSVMEADSIQELKNKVRDARASVNVKVEKRA